jgi:hypothetical protein
MKRNSKLVENSEFKREQHKASFIKNNYIKMTGRDDYLSIFIFSMKNGI